MSKAKNIVFGLHHFNFALKKCFKVSCKDNDGVYGIKASDGNFILH
jgi:hypothetical protein